MFDLAQPLEFEESEDDISLLVGTLEWLDVLQEEQLAEAGEVEADYRDELVSMALEEVEDVDDDLDDGRQLAPRRRVRDEDDNEPVVFEALPPGAGVALVKPRGHRPPPPPEPTDFELQIRAFLDQQ